LLRARPIAAMVSTVSGTRVVYDKEGTDPCKCATHYCQRIHQRRRKRPAPRLREVAGGAGPARAHQPVPTQPHGRGLSREERGNNADAHLKRAAQTGCTSQVMGREVVVAVTNGRQDGFALLTRTFGTWERIFSGQAEWLARESRRAAAEAGAGQDHRGMRVST
jgi:hypothetical protein